MTNSQCPTNDQGMTNPEVQMRNEEVPAAMVIGHLGLVIPWSLVGHWELVIA
jgi:hypothetical protein